MKLLNINYWYGLVWTNILSYWKRASMRAVNLMDRSIQHTRSIMTAFIVVLGAVALYHINGYVFDKYFFMDIVVLLVLPIIAGMLDRKTFV